MTITATPDLGMFLLSHQALRRDYARLEAAIRRLSPSSVPAAAALRDAFEVLERMLVLHHTAEDTLLWPALRERRPELAGVLEALEAQHVAADGWLEAVRDGIDRLAGGSTPDRDAVYGRLVDAAASLAAELSAHLDQEEEIVVPAITEALTVEEWEAIDVRRRASLSPEEMATSVAWVLSVLPAADRERAASAKLPPEVVGRWRDEWAPSLEVRIAALADAA